VHPPSAHVRERSVVEEPSPRVHRARLTSVDLTIESPLRWAAPPGFSPRRHETLPHFLSRSAGIQRARPPFALSVDGAAALTNVASRLIAGRLGSGVGRLACAVRCCSYRRHPPCAFVGGAFRRSLLILLRHSEQHNDIATGALLLISNLSEYHGGVGCVGDGEGEGNTNCCASTHDSHPRPRRRHLFIGLSRAPAAFAAIVGEVEGLVRKRYLPLAARSPSRGRSKRAPC
jgi:hypothetical protein